MNARAIADVDRSEQWTTAGLSFAQERMWFEEQLDPDNVSNNCPTTLELTGVLRLPQLEQAINEVIRRHEALRTRFVARDGQPLQEVAPSLRIAIHVVDLQGAAVDEAWLRAVTVEESVRPLPLDRLPLIRLTLFRLAPTRHVLHMTTHHIVWDAWSLGVVLRELAAIFEDYGAGRPSRLAPLATQYRDYAEAERRQAASAAARSSLEYWRTQVRDIVPLQLPTDAPRPRVRTFRGTSHTCELPADLWERVEGLCIERRVSPFMFVLSALHLYLSWVSGGKTIPIGVPIANRTKPDREALIGFVVNVLVTRGDRRRGGTFEELLHGVREEVLDAYAHAEYPFAKVVEDLNPVRSLTASPLFQVMLVYLNTPLPRPSLSGLDVSCWYIENVTAKQDLTLTVSARDGKVLAAWEYNSALFAPETIARFSRQFATLLDLLADGQSPSPVSLRDGGEQAAVDRWNATVRPEWRGGTLTELVALRQPADRVALICGDRQITFGALRRQVASLASRLTACGVGPDIHVGMLVPRSPESVVGMLAVFAAGGAGVPLDDSWPRQRIADALEAARVALLLTTPATRALAEGLGVPMLEMPATIADHVASGWCRRDVAASNIAYLTFTSGSTGAPKAIEIPRDAVWSGLGALVEQFALTDEDVFTAVTTPVFDIAVLEWALPLMRGGRVVIATREQVRDPRELGRIIASEQPTIMQATPSLWRMLLDSGWTGEPGLTALTGGESLGPDLAARLGAKCRAVWNLYGTSETTLWSTAGAVTDTAPHLGAPLANTSLFLLGRDGDPLPSGFEGELFIAGAGVARGYLHQPRLTAERFVPDPWSAEPGARMFRTGDLARWEVDGRLRLLARADAQVKVRGIRLEPGEIEECLRRHPAIRDAAVCPRQTAHDIRLIGYVTLQAPPEPDGGLATGGVRAADPERVLATLAGWVRERLPEYMVPAQFVRLDAFPLTTSGKIDRKALPDPEPPRRADRDEREVACLSPIEQAVQAAWQRSLGREDIGASGHFFDLGGNSILAAQMCLTLSALLGVQVPVRLIFEHPTFGAFAAHAGALRSSRARAPLPELTSDRDRRFDPFPLTDVQEAYLLGRIGMFALGDVATHSYFEIDAANLDVDRFESAWRVVVRRHDMLRAVFSLEGTQRVLPEVPPYTIAREDLRSLRAEERERKLLAIRHDMSHKVHPADRWPLFEIRATQHDGDVVRLHISMDALICDAFSSALLSAECLALYRDPSPRDDEPAVTFRDYVLGMRAIESSDIFRDSETYWNERLSSAFRGPDLPVVAAGREEAARFDRRSVRLTRDAWQRLRAFAIGKGLSPTVVVLTAFGEVLARWSRTQRFVVNLTLFNRLPLHADVNRVVGDFTSITLLEMDLSSSAAFEARAAATQRRLWDDLDHRFFSGVRVLREARRRYGTGQEILAPVVFTSTLGLGAEDEPSNSFGREVFSIGQTPQVWLDHKVYEQHGTLGVDWDFATGLFPDGTIDAMFESYVELLTRLADEPDRWTIDWRSGPLAAASVGSAAAVLEAAAPAFDPADTLHGLFLEQARAAPECIAVVAHDRTLTYGELDIRSRECAAILAARGVAAEERIGVVVPKGWEQSVAILAVLRAGGAYLPIEPGEPEDRRFRMLRNGGVRLVLTTAALAETLGWPEQCEPIAIPRDGETPSEMLAGMSTFRDAAIAPDRLAYVIYTSGSTGQPKGVMIEHGAAVNTLRDLKARLALTAGDRTLALSALSFDLSVFDAFGIWAAGGAVVYPDPARSKDPGHWAALLESERVTIWNTVPALMEILVESTTARDTALRWVMLSGDWIPVNLPPKVRTRWPGARQFGLGGATEASIWSILRPIDVIDPSWTRIPYGRAMERQSVGVLDERLQPTPPWVVGEIVIGGVGLARGYLNDPVLSAQRFITHPRTGARLYRTGDLGRLLPDGEIEILGRVDQQVKINGYRIELCEIEAVVAQQTGIQQAVVDVDTDAAGGRELIAYLVERQHPAPVCIDRSAVTLRLAQRAIRQFPAETRSIALRDRVIGDERVRGLARQSYRYYADAPPPLASIEQCLSAAAARLAPAASHGDVRLTKTWLERLLGRLGQTRVPGNPFPKYRYPSAGSLYPVQTYVSIPVSAIPRVASGTYYYDPRAHRLVRLGPAADPSGASPRLWLVAELSAIEDSYPDASARFCALEAGYMCGLLMDAPLRRTARTDGLALGATQRVVTAYEIEGGAPPMPMTAAPRVLLWAGGNGLHGMPPGCYARDRSGQWVRSGSAAALDARWFVGNEDLVERSQFLLLAAAADATADSFIDAGTLGQVLMEESPVHGIGLCPLGEIAEEVSAAAGRGTIVHAWAGGSIDPIQTREWMRMPAPLDREGLTRQCRDRVARQLPAYMHPSRYVFVDRLPLSSNHKVDRARLKALARQAPGAPVAAGAAAASETERAIVAMLERTLERPVTDVEMSFFEMGASSLIIIRLYGLVNARYPNRVSFQQLFDHPSVRGVARLVDGAAVPPAEPAPVTEVIEI